MILKYACIYSISYGSLNIFILHFIVRTIIFPYKKFPNNSQTTMNSLLTLEEVLEVEVQLLQNHEKKHSLSSYYIPVDNEEESNFQKNDELAAILNKEYGIPEVISCGQDCNNIFRVLTAVLTRVFFVGNPFASDKKLDRKGRYALLQNLKCTLYSEKLDLRMIKNGPIFSLSSKDMKKILVELFQVLTYHNGPIEIILDKYPIVQEIYILFLRTVLLLATRGLQDPEQNYQNYQKKVEKNSIELLLDYFDITYQKRQGLYLMFEDNLYIYTSHEANDIAYGDLRENFSNKSQNQIIPNKIQQNNELNFQEQELDALAGGEKETAVSTPTPCFAELNDEEINFKQVQASGRSTHRQTLHQTKIAVQEPTSRIQIGQYKKSCTEKNNLSGDTTICQRSMKIISTQSSPRKKQKVSFQVYYDKESNAQKYYGRKLQAIPSPLPSTPQEMDEWQNFMNPFQQKCMQSCWEFLSENEEEISDKQVLQKMQRKKLMRSNLLQSQKYGLQQSKLKLKKGSSYHEHYSTHNDSNKSVRQKTAIINKAESNDYSESYRSCACSSMKSKRNSLNSNVIRANYVPVINIKDQSTTSLHIHHRQKVRKTVQVQKPRIFFTYCQEKEIINLNQKINFVERGNSFLKGISHIQTEPVYFSTRRNMNGIKSFLFP